MFMGLISKKEQMPHLATLTCTLCLCGSIRQKYWLQAQDNIVAGELMGRMPAA